MLYIHPYTCPLPIDHPVPDNRCLTKKRKRKENNHKKSESSGDSVQWTSRAMWRYIARCHCARLARRNNAIFRPNERYSRSNATSNARYYYRRDWNHDAGERWDSIAFTARISSDSNKLCSVHSVDCHCHGCNKSVLSLVPRLSTWRYPHLLPSAPAAGRRRRRLELSIYIFCRRALSSKPTGSRCCCR